MIRFRLWLWGAILAALILGGCTQTATPPIEIRLSDIVTPTPLPPNATSPPDEATLRMAVAAVNSPHSTLVHYAHLVNYLADRLSLSGRLVQGKTYAKINEMVAQNGVSLAMVCTNPYVEGHAAFGMEAIAVPQINGQAVYYSYLIAGKESPAESLEAMRGRSFAFTDPLSNSGRLVIVYQLARLGETPDAFFDRYIFTYSHEYAIKAVSDGLVDGAAVDSLIYDYLAATAPEQVANTKIVARYGPFGSNPVVVPPDIDPELKQKLQDLLLTMHQNPDGQQVLADLGIDKFVRPDDSAYDSVREMRQFLKASGVTQ